MINLNFEISFQFVLNLSHILFTACENDHLLSIFDLNIFHTGGVKLQKFSGRDLSKKIYFTEAGSLVNFKALSNMLW